MFNPLERWKNSNPIESNYFDNFLTAGLGKEFEKILNGKSDFTEEEDKYVIELEVPGVKKDEIKINLHNDDMIIEWQRVNEKKGKLLKKHYERSEGSFTRSFHTKGSDPSKVDAELKDGVLKIIVYKNDEYKAKRIEIK